MIFSFAFIQQRNKLVSYSIAYVSHVFIFLIDYGNKQEY